METLLVLPEKFAAKFFTKFSALFCWDIQSKKTSAKTSALNSNDPAQQNWRNFREKLHDEVLQGTLAKIFGFGRDRESSFSGGVFSFLFPKQASKLNG